MKKLFLSLFVGLIGLISFCSAGSYSFDFEIPAGTYNNDNMLFIYPFIPSKDITNQLNITFECSFSSFDGTFSDTSNFNVYLYGWSFFLQQASNTAVVSNILSSNIFNSNGIVYSGYRNLNMGSNIKQFYGFGFSLWRNGPVVINKAITGTCLLSGNSVGNFISSCPTCPSQYTSEECQVEYGLVTSGVLNQCNNNLLSCQSSLSGCQSSLSGRNNTLNNCSNNLLSCESSLASCIQSNCPIDTGDVMWSSLWINGIQHLGKPVINISIPDNIYWDYITNDEEFDLYVGSGYDQEYIDGIISINSYRPTSEDFTSVFVSGLTLIMPYIIFVLFLLFMRKLIKRIFK